MRLRSMLLVLVACAVVGGAIGGWAYVTRTPRITLCSLSGPVGNGTAQSDAQAEAERQASRDACQADADRQNAEAARFDPVGFAIWTAIGASLLILVGGFLAAAYGTSRPRQSLRGRGW